MTHNRFPLRMMALFLGALLLLPAAFANLDDIRERGYAVIVMSGEYPPFSMPDEDGNMIGMDADVATEIAARLGVEARLQQAEFSTIVGGVQAGTYDFSVASHAATEERRRAVGFSDTPYYYSGGQLFIHEDLDYASLDEMAADDAGIAVDLGGTNQHYLEDNGYPNVDTYSGIQDSLLAVASGRAAGVFTSPIVGFIAMDEGQPIKPIDGLIFEENAYVLFAHGNDELAAAINQALADMRADGTLLEISMKWIGGDIVTPPAE